MRQRDVVYRDRTQPEPHLSPGPHRGRCRVHRDADARPTPSEAEALEFSPKGLLIDGRFVPASGGRTVGVEDPATGRTIAKVADATPADCLAALEAAVAAQGAICSPRARVCTRRA